MSNNRPHHHHQLHHGNIPPIQSHATNYTYPMMPHPGVPTQHIPGMYTQVGVNRMSVPQTVPQTLYCYNQQPQMNEVQMKMQIREQNYHIQQQRLRSFNASSSQKRVNPDDLIQSMFGKPTITVKNNKRTLVNSQQTTPPMVAANPVPQPEIIPKAISQQEQVTALSKIVPQNVSVQQLPENNKKKLEDMLLECSDLMRPGKAHSFPTKPSTKEKTSQRKTSTEGGQTRFPNWCFNENQIPDLYQRIQQAVTNDNIIETNLLYPILLSSGLNRDVLGHIWSLVNQTTPGQLLTHELYAALTLIALAQNGYKFTSLDILHPLARPLVPYLKEVIVQSSSATPSETKDFTSIDANTKPDTLDDNQEEFTEFLGFAPTVQPPSLGSSAVGNRLANYNVGLSPPAKEKAQPKEALTTNKEMHEFTDFHKAAGDGLTVIPLSEISTEKPTEISIVDKLNEDKYSIFRELDRERHNSESSDKTDDEFGDFLSGTETKIEEIITTSPLMMSAQDPLKSISNPHQNIRPFNLKPVGEKSVDSFIQTSLTQFQMTSFDDRHLVITKSTPQDDFEFGDFVSPDGNSLGQLVIKDTGSAESQSVSSLELGPVDAVIAGNDNASLRSLEFKATFPDDEYGDLQCNADSLSVSQPKEMINNSTPCTILDDPYRFVNSNTQSDLERNAEEWERCLESCYELIEGANCILSDMTSESVCDEVLCSDEGINYLRSIIEIYLITARLQHSIKNSGLANDSLNKLLRNINTSWTNLSSFISKSNLMPREEIYESTDGTLNSNEQNNVQVCGVCLLSISTSDKTNTIHSFEFSGRLYHASCANFWVNCVNSLLPALTRQQQLLY